MRRRALWRCGPCRTHPRRGRAERVVAWAWSRPRAGTALRPASRPWRARSGHAWPGSARAGWRATRPRRFWPGMWRLRPGGTCGRGDRWPHRARRRALNAALAVTRRLFTPIRGGLLRITGPARRARRSRPRTGRGRGSDRRACLGRGRNRRRRRSRSGRVIRPLPWGTLGATPLPVRLAAWCGHGGSALNLRLPRRLLVRLLSLLIRESLCKPADDWRFDRG